MNLWTYGLDLIFYLFDNTTTKIYIYYAYPCILTQCCRLRSKSKLQNRQLALMLTTLLL